MFLLLIPEIGPRFPDGQGEVMEVPVNICHYILIFLGILVVVAVPDPVYKSKTWI
jgi:hypothetical protein